MAGSAYYGLAGSCVYLLRAAFARKSLTKPRLFGILGTFSCSFRPRTGDRNTTHLQPGEQPNTACRTRSARHGVAHGSGNAILLPHVMRFNAGRPEGAKRLKDIATALGLTAPADPVEAANAAADNVSELLIATSHPVKLAEVKVPKDDLEATAESAFLDPANLYNPRAVSFPAEITELYQGAY